MNFVFFSFAFTLSTLNPPVVKTLVLSLSFLIFRRSAFQRSSMEEEAPVTVSGVFLLHFLPTSATFNSRRSRVMSCRIKDLFDSFDLMDLLSSPEPDTPTTGSAVHPLPASDVLQLPAGVVDDVFATAPSFEPQLSSVSLQTLISE